MRVSKYLKVLGVLILPFLGYQVLLGLNMAVADRELSPLGSTEDRAYLDTLPGSRLMNLSNIEIPIREGFPFCETFIGNDPRPNAILGGSLMSGAPNPNVQLTGNALQLTSNGMDENGYVFVDIPFSSAFGLKVSFEFASFGGTGADGFSFFMFDGLINASDFEIGGTGGALGYTPVRFPNDDTPTLLTPGLKGAYIGIGFDELGNFGNSRDGRNGGFEDPTNGPNTQNRPLFQHSVVVRGPSDGPSTIPLRDRDRINDHISGFMGPRWDSYKFIDGRIFDPAATGTVVTSVAPPEVADVSSFLHPDRLELDTDTFAAACPDEGFRKVFIDLNPVDVNDRSQGYQVEVQMLVNDAGLGGVRLINVFNGPINYPFGAPELLKVGFAAATGASTNFHHIRNVTVQVSNEDVLEKPLVEPLNQAVCEGETDSFELDVELRNDTANAFIRCLQLYYTEQEAADVLIQNGISIPFPPAADINTLCPTGNCVDLLCRPEFTSRTAYDNVTGEVAGTFEVFLTVEGGREVPRVRFIAQPGYSGETTIYYTATDNFGQVSDPKPITIFISPQPEPIITTLDPLVWEQQEASQIRVLFESGLTDTSFDYQWFVDGNPITGANDPTYLATAAGQYSVEVSNPFGCLGTSQEIVSILIVDDLNPALTATNETCSDLGAVRVTFNGAAVTGVSSDGSSGNEKYKIETNTGTLIQDWVFLSPGQNQVDITGLPAGQYVFYIGDEFRSGQPGSDGTPLYRHEIPFEILTVQNPLQLLSVIPSPELCFGAGGAVEVTVSGGAGVGSYGFELTSGNSGQVYLPSSSTAGVATFDNLPQDSYTVTVTSSTRCSVTDSFVIGGPTAPLAITLENLEGISCGVVDSGQITWSLAGGTSPYTFVSITKDGALQTGISPTSTGANYTFDGLERGEYSVVFEDANGCTITSSPVLLDEQVAPVFDVNDPEICEGEPGFLEVSILELSNSSPVFQWFTPDGQEITSNGTISGVTYTFVDDGNPATPPVIQVDGLTPGDYDYTLVITGDNTCSQPDQTATISVNPLPTSSDSILTNLTCFQSGDGAIEVVLSAGLDLSDYSFELIGIRPAQDSNRFEGLDAGNYSVSVVNKASGCSLLISNLILTQPDAIAFLDVTSDDPTCGIPNGSIGFALAGGTPAYSVEINGLPLSDFDHTLSGNQFEVNNLSEGTYDIAVTDANGCTEVLAPITLQNDPLDPLNVQLIDLEICVGDDATFLPTVTTPNPFTFFWAKDSLGTEIITTTTTPDSQGLTYQVDSGTGELTVQGLDIGQNEFYFFVEGANLCTYPPFVARATVYPPISTSLSVENETCFGDADGSITITASGADDIFEYSLDGGAFSPVNSFSGLAPGTYLIEIRAGIGCTASVSAEVLGPTGPITVNTPDLIRASCGEANGSIENLLISGGWGQYDVSWHEGSVTGPEVSGDQNGAFNLFPGTYFLSVRDLEGCAAVFQFEVEAASDPEYQLVPTQDICEGDVAVFEPIHLAPDPSLPPAAFTEVRWFKSPGQVDEIVDGPDPSQPGVVYTIDSSDWLNPSLSVSGLEPGTHDFYFYVVCTGEELATSVEVFGTPSVDFDVTAVSCFDATDGRIQVLSGGDPSYEYSINGAAPISESDLAAMTFAPGVYTLEVTIANLGCAMAPVDLTIARPDAPLAISVTEVVEPACGVANGRITGAISGGWAPYSVELIQSGLVVQTSTSATGDFSFLSVDQGDYILRATDDLGCVVDSDIISLIYGPTRIIVQDQSICEGEDVTLTPQLEPASASPTFNWYFDAAKSNPITSSASPAADGNIYQISSSGELTISGLQAVDSPVTYYLSVDGSDVCAGFTASPEVRINPLPQVTAQVANVACFGDPGTIELVASAGNGSFSYSIDGVNFGSQNVFEVGPGNYEGFVESGGCIVSTGQIVVDGPSAPLAFNSISVTDPNCNTANGAISLVVSGGYGPDYSVDLFRNNVLTASNTFASSAVSFTNLLSGDYRLEISDGSCTVQTDIITLNDVPTPVAADSQVICEGETASLTPSTTQSTSVPTWEWYRDAAGTDRIVNGSSDGSVRYVINSSGVLQISGLEGSETPYSYYLGVSGTNVCSPELLEVTVTVHDIPNLRVSNPSIVCDPSQTVDLTEFIEGFNPNVYDYEIQNPSGQAMRLDEISDVSDTGDYRVRSSFKNKGCWSEVQRIRVIISDTELIPEFQYEADLGGGVLLPDAQAQIFEPVSFEDLSLGKIIIWNWDFGDGATSQEQNPTHSYSEKGIFTVKLTTIDEFGCMAEVQKTIEVLDDYLVIIPNAFTPAGTKNQLFKPQFRGIVSLEFYIFSTWGELIYEFSGLEDQGWDGTVNGSPAIPGNYVYRGRFTSASGEVVERAGVFTLIR
ncbi:PKD domain-containing protein [Algoriphagus namhaensis]